MATEHIDGKDKGKIMLYALSTCGWCKKTKELLNQLGVAYTYINVNDLTGPELAGITQDVKRWNPACSYPTLVIKDQKCIVGFDEEKIRTELS